MVTEPVILKRLESRVVEFGGAAHTGWLPSGAATPRPTSRQSITLTLVIEKLGEDSFLLVWNGSEPNFGGDTWHQSLEDAVHQAELWFGISPLEWRDA